LLVGDRARADAPLPTAEASGAKRSGVYLVQPAGARGQAASERLIRDYAERSGLALQPLDQPDAAQAAPEGRPEDMEVLRGVERALREARALSAELREASALRVLASAEQDLLGALSVPGVHAFLAEVYVQLALCAAQLNEEGLFESALTRALSLDPTRRIEAAEAPPAIVARARALAQSRDQAGRSENRLQTQPPQASAWLDGQPIAVGDPGFRARVGAHVLVVRAPGHAPYATLITLDAGRRAPLVLTLSPTARELDRRALLAAGTREMRETRALALARAAAEPVFLFEMGGGPDARALVQRCSAAGCEPARGVDRAGRLQAPFRDRRSAHVWLEGFAPAGTERAPGREQRPVWQRWPLWTGVGALLLAGVATAVWVTRPAEQRATRSLEIDASALPR
jgi:hypothetical protein